MKERELLLSQLTLLDTSHYRATGLSESPRRYKHEPLRFRTRLAQVYDKLSNEDLQELINIKKGL
jgi:hypothetical protein